MRRSSRLALQLTGLTGAALILAQNARPGVFSSPAVAQTPPSAACTFPTIALANVEQTAWRLFVAANCPSNGGKVVWENWIEQNDLYTKPGARAALLSEPGRRLHGSPLAERLEAQKRGAMMMLVPSTDCGSMRGPPPNVVATKICEEAHLNPAAAGFITSHGYQFRAGQVKAAKAKVDIQFTKPSIEVKADWIPATDFKTPFSCASPPAGLHVEVFDGACYALAGIHVSSKLLDKWVWATFEPQSMLTNPLRCVTFGSCHDAWGSSPATSNGGLGGFTRQTANVRTLMTDAKLAPEFLNYRMDGAQSGFTSPTYLGNSIIEGENVGMTKGTASCISCHSESSISTTGQEGQVSALVGKEYHPPKGYIARDFVWSLGLAQ